MRVSKDGNKVTLIRDEARLLYRLAAGSMANLHPDVCSERLDNPWIYKLGQKVGRS